MRFPLPALLVALCFVASNCGPEPPTVTYRYAPLSYDDAGLSRLEGTATNNDSRMRTLILTVRCSSGETRDFDIPNVAAGATVEFSEFALCNDASTSASIGATSYAD